MIGTTIGNFRVVERIGDGGMGAVYRAVDQMLDREVAIKVLRPELARNGSLIERFRQEAIALARLNHPRIATLHSLEKHGDSLLMIMEYVRGDTFEALVQRSGRLAWPRAVELCAATLDALDHAHDKGVIHRDIKPANIMLASGGGVKVMDFGIARLMGKNRQTQVGHSVGTPMYMAPEQLRGEEVDGRTDIYATGAVLFELITGRMAFEADSDFALMMKQLEEAPPLVGPLVPGVPPVVDEMIARAMSKRREDRFASAAIFRDALMDVVAAHGASAKRTPVPAETRLAVPSVATRIIDSRPLDARPASTQGESRPSATPAETRLAPAAHVADTRLAPPIEPTRIAGHGEAAPQPTAPASRLRDWRIFAVAGGLFTAAGIAVMLARVPAVPPAPGAAGAPTSAARPAIDSAALAQGGAVISSGDVPTRGEDASSLIINRPAAPAGAGGTEPPKAPPATPPSTPPRAGGDRGAGAGAGPGRGGSGGSGAGSSGDTRAGDTRAGDTRGKGSEPPPPVVATPVPPPPVARETPAEDGEAEAGRRIRAALENAASLLSGRDPSVAGMLDDRVQDAWAALMKEGRISLAVAGAPDVQRGGGRATAEFDGTVNVRSPFGANRRRNARFAAELERGASAWRVVRLRALGALDLK